MESLNNSPAGPSALTPSVVHYDVIDAVVGLVPGDALFAIRHTRQKISDATQSSYELFFDPAGQSLAIRDRLLVAWYACLLSGAMGLAQHYQAALAPHDGDLAIAAAVAADQIDDLAPSSLKAMLVFTRKLIVKPVEGDQAQINQLQAAGMAAADIVTLAQLIAFLSYQIRVTAGLQAMKALESQ